MAVNDIGRDYFFIGIIKWFVIGGCLFKCVIYFFGSYFFLRIDISLVIEFVFIGMCCVWFFSLLFSFGIIRLMVFVVFVVWGMIFFVAVCEVCKFLLCGLFISDWVLV